MRKWADFLFILIFVMFLVGCSNKSALSEDPNQQTEYEYKEEEQVISSFPTATSTVARPLPIPTRTPAPPTPAIVELDYGNMVTFNWNTDDEYKNWIFQGERYQTAHVSINPAHSDASETVTLMLEAHDGTLLASNRGEDRAELEVVLPHDGAYMIRATRQNASAASGEYRLWLFPGSQLQIYLADFSVGDAAYQRIVERMTDTRKPSWREGWQLVVLDLVIENTGPVAGYSPESISGWLIDSGGYRREIEYMFDPFDGEIAFLSSYNRWLIYPGLRHPFFTYTLIPLNQTPQAFTLIMEGSNSVYEFDLDDSVVKKTVPFDEPPSNFPELGHDPIISYSEVDLFRVTYSDFYFRENPYHDGHVTLEYNVEVENLGGYDLRDSENHIHPPTLIAMDNHGRYYTGGLAFIYDVPPGYVKQGQGMALVLGRPHKDFDWIWLGLFEPGSQRPLGQMTLPAPSPSEIREAPF